jgi:tight adherence protein C
VNTFILIAGLVLLAFAVALLVQAFARARGDSEVVEQIGAYGFRGFTSKVASEGSTRASLSELPTRIGGWLSSRIGNRSEEETRRRLIAAGWYSTSPTAFLGYRLISAIALTGLFVFFAAVTGQNSLIFIVGLVLAALCGWYLPSIILNRKTQERHHQIERELPELIDLLVVTVEAGIGFNGSLRLAAEELVGPLAQELRLTLQEQSMGLSTGEALENLAYRVDTPGMRAFVRGISQGETLGVSISQILRNIADEMRKRRKAMAEELAQKAPIKMLFPLIFLIFPAMFVVLLLPALIAISQNLGS